MFGLSAIPAFFQALGMLFLPYSPRWLVIKGKDEKVSIPLLYVLLYFYSMRIALR